MQLTKQAFAFVFDRATGKPVWPIEERPVPASDMPGERTATHAAVSDQAAAFDRQGVDRRRSDRLHAGAARRSGRARQALPDRAAVHAAIVRGEGPDGIRGTIQLPGSVGGADWQGGGVRSGDRHAVRAVDHRSVHRGHHQGRSEEHRTCTTCPARAPGPPGPQGLPLFKPPYGRITAIDLNKGEQVWMVPNGDGPRDHPLLKPLNLPPLGNPGRGAPLVTKTLLFVGEGDPVMAALGSRLRPEMPATLAPGAGGRKFRAYDKATGAMVWETELPAGTTGAPMTYMFEGKQYIVVAIGSTEPQRGVRRAQSSVRRRRRRFRPVWCNCEPYSVAMAI